MLRIVDNFVFFDNNFLAPTYKVPIIYPDIDTPLLYANSSLQCFQAIKSLLFRDYESLAKIMEALASNDILINGHNVANYNSKIWRDKKYNIMCDIEMQKYTQNPNLMNKLVSHEYDQKTFCYCNPIDTYWGIGLGIHNSNITDISKWNGQNMYGKIIQNIRNSLLL